MDVFIANHNIFCWSFVVNQMGNSRNQQRRVGVKRPGLAQRAQALQEEQIRLDAVLARERAAERQRQCQANKRCLEEASRNLPRSDEGAPAHDLRRRNATRVSNKIVQFIIEEFERVRRGLDFRKAVLESMLRNNTLLLHLPNYYSCPSKARFQYSFIQSYRTKLESLKIPTSIERLVRKTTILEAAVSRDVKCLETF